MTALQLANVLQAVVAAASAVTVLFWMLRWARLDSLRQKLFALRDELFDFAADGYISFNDPAYQLLRNEMNAIIRFAHQLTLFRMLMTAFMRTAQGPIQELEWNKAWDTALSKIEDPMVRQKMCAFRARAMHNMLKHLVTGSPLLLLAIGVVMCVTRLGRAGAASYTSFRQLAQIASKQVFVGPFDPRRLEEDAFGDRAAVA